MIGQTTSGYETVGKLGGGGMGVHKARDPRLQSFVALKFLPNPVSTAEEVKTRKRESGVFRKSVPGSGGST